MAAVVNLLAALGGVHDFWSPKIIARVNDQVVKVAKVRASIAWHAHAHEDELFLVLKGRLRIEVQNREAIVLDEGDIDVV